MNNIEESIVLMMNKLVLFVYFIFAAFISSYLY